jgi:SAM-dependent methyltransferase
MWPPFLPVPKRDTIRVVIGLPVEGDALGAALLAHLDEGGSAGVHVIERDDGYVACDGAHLYFTEIGKWFAVEESVPYRVRGRILDIGAGGGRFAIELQRCGYNVVALDVSPGCLEACRRIGIEQTFLGTIFELARQEPEPFDTFLLMGHNYGLLGGPQQATGFMDTLRTMANPGAKIIGTNRDPLATSDPVHLAYHQMNRERGREPAQMTIRVRWRNLATPWLDYWFLPLQQLEEIAAECGWELTGTAFENDHYLAELTLVAN